LRSASCAVAGGEKPVVTSLAGFEFSFGFGPPEPVVTSMAGFESDEPVATNVAGFGGFRPQPSGAPSATPADRK
jgi:hypothetical protein